MRQKILVLMAAAPLSLLTITAANAMPISQNLPTVSDVNQVRWFCNEWGRCWHRPDYDRPYRYHYRGDDDDWRWRRYRYGYGAYSWPHYWGEHRGWHHRGEDDDD